MQTSTQNKQGIPTEQHGCIPGGGSQHDFRNQSTLYQLEQGQNNRSTYRFQEGDATDGTSCEPSGPCKSTRQFFSSETQRNTMKTGTQIVGQYGSPQSGPGGHPIPRLSAL